MSNTNSHRLPDIIGIGPERTGTTWLHRVLDGHVNLPYGIKETRFFTTFYDQGVDWYARHFRHAADDRKVVEICPYLFNPHAPGRIKTHIPNCRVIATLRNPVDLTYSLYKLARRQAWHGGTLDQVLEVHPEIGGGNRYSFHLKTWFETFGRENVLVTMYDDLCEDPQRYLNQVTDFMGIARIALSERPEIGDNVNSFDRAPKNRRLARRAIRARQWLRRRQTYRVFNFLEQAGVWNFCLGRGELFDPLTSEQEERLRARYMPEVESLERMLRIDLSGWKKPRITSDGVAAESRIRKVGIERAGSSSVCSLRTSVES